MPKIVIDAIDIKLLDRLQNDASLSNQALAGLLHISPPTCLRRIKRLRESGLIEREIAVLSVDQLALVLGNGLCAIAEVTLDRQDQGALDAFEQRAVLEGAVQQCYRVSPGPDFCLVLQVADMPDYLALAQRLFTADANVRNVKTFFSIKRSKFDARVPLPVKPAAV